MSERLLVSGSTQGLHALVAFNKSVFEAHAQVASLVAARLGPRFGEVFARPERSGDEIRWMTSASGPIRPWTALTAAEQQHFNSVRTAMGEALASLVVDLTGYGINTKSGNLGQLLHAALEVPGIDHLFVVGDALVLSFWGFRRAGASPFNPFAVAELPPVVEPPLLPPTVERRSLWPWLLLLLALLLALGLAWFLWCRLHHGAPQLPIEEPKPIEMPRPAVPLVEPVPFIPPAPPPPLPAQPPDLPQQNWDKHDLSMLKGCWSLGEDYDLGLTKNGKTRPAHVFTERVCFDDASGHGVRTTRVKSDGVDYECTADITAHFTSDSRLMTHQKDTLCTNGETTWRGNSLDCERRPDGTADCWNKYDNDDNSNQPFMQMFKKLFPNLPFPEQRQQQDASKGDKLWFRRE